MTPQELASHLKQDTDFVTSDEAAGDQLTITVDPGKWTEVAGHLRECGRCSFDFFTFLTATDREADGFDVTAHVFSVRRSHHLTFKTRIGRDGSSLPTLSEVWGGANWHERECWELFGIGFDGHPNLVKLVLPEEFEGNPLRKDFLLMTREAKEWPGLKEPGGGEKEEGGE